MISSRFLVTVIVTALVIGVSAPVLAQDGSAPPPEYTTDLDKALDDIQNKEPPVSVEKPPEPAATAPAPAAQAATPEQFNNTPEKINEETKAPDSPAAAPEEATIPPPAPLSRVVEVQPNASFFGLSIGMYAPFSEKAKGAFLNLEWHPGVKIVGILQPIFGAFVTTKGAMMGYGGLGTPFNLGKRIFVMPSFSVGGYAHGDGRDLGQALVYRAGGELSYVFDDKSRFGINAHVISNGKSTHREDNTTMIGLVYTTPIDFLSGKPKPAPLTVIKEPVATIPLSLPAEQPAVKAVQAPAVVAEPHAADKAVLEKSVK